MKFWVDVVLIIINLGVAVYVWWTNRNKATNERFDELANRIGDIEKKIDRPCANHPNFEARLDSIDKGVAKIDGRLEGINRMVDLLTQNELQGGK
jgi:hypothetical protein